MFGELAVCWQHEREVVEYVLGADERTVPVGMSESRLRFGAEELLQEWLEAKRERDREEDAERKAEDERQKSREQERATNRETRRRARKAARQDLPPRPNPFRAIE